MTRSKANVALMSGK